MPVGTDLFHFTALLLTVKLLFISRSFCNRYICTMYKNVIAESVK